MSLFQKAATHEIFKVAVVWLCGRRRVLVAVSGRNIADSVLTAARLPGWRWMQMRGEEGLHTGVPLQNRVWFLLQPSCAVQWWSAGV